MELSVHGAMCDLNLTSSNTDIRAESLRQIQASIAVTTELGAHIVVVHPDRLMIHDWTNVGLTVDIAHLNTFGDPVQLLYAINPAWIAHVHLSDSGPQRTHVPLGEGELDLLEVLAAIEVRYEGGVLAADEMCRICSTTRLSGSRPIRLLALEVVPRLELLLRCS